MYNFFPLTLCPSFITTSGVTTSYSSGSTVSVFKNNTTMEKSHPRKVYSYDLKLAQFCTNSVHTSVGSTDTSEGYCCQSYYKNGQKQQCCSKIHLKSLFALKHLAQVKLKFTTQQSAFYRESPSFIT